MSQTKDSKPRQKHLRGSAYSHARYCADVLCDPDTPKDLEQAARFGLTELCTLLGLQMPETAPTPRAWKAVRKIYLDARRTIEQLVAKHPKATFSDFHGRSRQIIEQELYTISGLTLQVAEQLSELLHHLWCKDNSEGYAENPNRGSQNNYALKRSPAYVLRQLKDFQHTRHLIEEHGQAKVLEAHKARLTLSTQAFLEITRQIDRRPLEDFIKGTHFRATLTPDIGKQ